MRSEYNQAVLDKCGNTADFFVELSFLGKEIDAKMSRSKAIGTDAMECVLALLTPENALACRVSLASGLRIGDVLDIRTEQLRQDSFTIREQKTGKKRRVILPEALRVACLSFAGRVYAFPHRLNDMKHRTRQAVWKDLHRASRALRAGEGLSPHSLRKSFAVRKYSACGDMRKVKELLNHSDEAVTCLYALAESVQLPSVGIPQR